MRYIDLRSDTTTLPTDKMRTAMANAEVGDDIYGDDPTVNLLQEKTAELLGMEAALFVSSGTMGNQLSIMAHTQRGEEIICEEDSHIVQSERSAIAILSQVMPKVIKGNDGMMDIDKITRSIRTVDVHHPKTSLICLENAHGNGMVAPLSYMEAVNKLAKANGIKTHLDGARLFNAATYLGCEVKEIAKHFDSVTFCLSKGLVAPVGAMIAGKKDFIDRVVENRKAIGGAMRQAGILAAAGIIAIEEMSLRLQEDHDNAQYLADKLLELGYVDLDKSKVHINMVFFRFNKDLEKVKQLQEYLFKNGVKTNEVGSNYGDELGLMRFLTHNGINREDIDVAVELIKKFFE